MPRRSTSLRPQVAEQTITRRDLLEWLGQGAVLSLGAAALLSCSDDSAAPPPVTDAAPIPDRGAFDFGQNGFSFQPGPPSGNAVFANWGERTVDSQDVTKILASWTLRVDGMVKTARTYTFADLIALTRTDQVTDFHCVEGWSVYDVPWSGVHMSELFKQVEPLPQATYVAFHTIGGTYNESMPISEAKEAKTLLGYGIAGNTLPLKHGFPLRVVIPRLLGYKNAKYVERLELTDKPLQGFWVKAGYSYDGQVPAARLRPGKY